MKINRKYADKSGWKKILEKRFKTMYVDDVDFKGYLSLVCVDKTAIPLIKKTCDETICILDDGYMWLEQYFIDKNFSISTIYDEDKNLVQWYIDIVKTIGITEDGIPYFDDLFLDIIATPTSDIEILDRDELDEALNENIITSEEYENVLEIAGYVIDNVLKDREKLVNSSNKYLDVILSNM